MVHGGVELETTPGGLRVYRWGRAPEAKGAGYRERATLEKPSLTIFRPVHWGTVAICASVAAGLVYACFQVSDLVGRGIFGLVAAAATLLALAVMTSMTITVDERLRVEWRSLFPRTERFNVDVDARAVRAISAVKLRPESRGPLSYDLVAVLESGESTRLATFDEAEAEYVADLLRKELGCA